MKIVLGIVLFILLSASLMLGYLFVETIGQLKIGPAYALAMVMLFIGLMMFAVYANKMLFDKKLSIRKWSLWVVGLICVQPLLWIMHVLFFSINPDVSNVCVMVSVVIAALKAFEGAVLMFYMLKNTDRQVQAA